jgi:plastocyanin
MFSLALLAIAAPFVVSAQQVHQVAVGSSNGTLSFDPEAIFANTGDVVSFTFHQKNHSVVQSSFADPCGPLAGGINSGFMPVSPDQTSDFPQYNITVMDSKPIWVYCAQTIPVSHCHKGMVFAVNCGPTGAPNSFDNFKASALALGAADASSSAAAASSAVATSAPPSGTDVAPPSSVTIPPAPEISTVTETITLASSTWTTTYGSYPNSPAPTPASLTGNVIKVIVGFNSTLTFNPSVVKALPRDTITFEFQSKNHTATQSSFASPCIHLNNVTSGQVGFDSGFMPVAAGSTSFPTWNVTVNDTSPVWVYCKQTNPVSHCGAGMVLSINPDESSPRNSTAFATIAKQLNGTVNAAVSPSASSGSTSPSPSTASQAGGAIRSATSLNTLGAIALLGGLMAML